MELQEHGKECNANHQDSVNNQPLLYVGVKSKIFGDVECFWKIVSSLRKGPKSQGGQQAWLKNLAQFHISWYAILDAVLTSYKETVF